MKPVSGRHISQHHRLIVVVVNRSLTAGLAVPDGQLALEGAKTTGDHQIEARRRRVFPQCRKRVGRRQLQAMPAGQVHQVRIIQSG